MIPTLRFLELVFGAEMTGFIEVRLIEDKKGGKPVLRKWYSNAAALVAEFEFLLQQSKLRNAAVFFGVLPRKEAGKGTADDVRGGRVVWADFDDKDFRDGPVGVDRAIASFAARPSIVIRSAHGKHCYWLLREEHAPVELSAVAQRIAKTLGADDAFDIPRLLRLLGTFNRKDPSNPIEVTLEKLDGDLRYNLSELTDALDMLGGPAPEPQRNAEQVTPGAEPGDESIKIATAPSDRVRSLVANNSKVRNYFLGMGKAEKDEHGQSLDTSGSGYDCSLALSLLKNGVSDPSEVATGLWFRPDGHARNKGLGYTSRTVRKAIEWLAAKDGSGGDGDAAGQGGARFGVEHVRIYTSVPPEYEFVILGVAVKLRPRDLQSAAAFEARYLEVFHRIPGVPRPRSKWVPLVNSWLADAELIEMPPEASDDGALREAVERAVEGFSEGDALEDLDRGQALRLEDGRRAFKTTAVMTAIRAGPLDAKLGAVCRVLRELGYESVTVKFPTKAVRAWVRSELPGTRAREES